MLAQFARIKYSFFLQTTYKEPKIMYYLPTKVKNMQKIHHALTPPSSRIQNNFDQNIAGTQPKTPLVRDDTT